MRQPGREEGEVWTGEAGCKGGRRGVGREGRERCQEERCVRKLGESGRGRKAPPWCSVSEEVGTKLRTLRMDNDDAHETVNKMLREMSRWRRGDSRDDSIGGGETTL